MITETSHISLRRYGQVKTSLWPISSPQKARSEASELYIRVNHVCPAIFDHHSQSCACTFEYASKVLGASTKHSSMNVEVAFIGADCEIGQFSCTV